MGNAAVIPLHHLDQPFLVPAFEVEMNGSPMPRNVVRDVMEVTFEDGVDKIDSFTLTFNNWNADERHPQFVGDGASESFWQIVQPGNGVRLSMGYQGRKPDFRVMTTAFVTSLEADFPESGSSRLTVRGLNVLDRFRLKQYTWSWPADRVGTVRDSEIAKELGNPPDTPDGKPGLPVKVRIDDKALAEERPQDHVFMNNEYPIVFLMRLARRNGYDMFITLDQSGREELYFGPSRRVQDHTYLLEWGKTLTSARATLSTARQVKKVVVLGWDRARKKPIRGEASIDGAGVEVPATVRALALANGREEVVTDDVVADEAAAKRKAQDLLSKITSTLVEVDGAVVGLPDLRAGRTVRLERFGTHLDGNYFVTETKHTINESGYRTTFKARLEGSQRTA